MFNSIISTELQIMLLSTFEWSILLIVSGVFTVGTFAVYRFFNEDADKSKKSVMIKIDRNGKHRYQIKEDIDNNRLTFWTKIILVIITLSLLFIPLRNWLYNS